MNELVTYYKSYLEVLKKSPHTIKQYIIDTKQFLNFMKDNHYTFEETMSKIIQSYNQYLEDTYSSVASINRKKASLHHFLLFLQQRNRINEIPENLLKPNQLENKSIQTLSMKKVEMVSTYWFNEYQSSSNSEYKWIALRNFCLVNIMLETGVKPSEIVGLKWSHIKEQEITILQNKKFRKLLLTESIVNWLDLFRYETENLLPQSKEGEFVWLGLGNKQNDSITVKTIERIFQSISENLGFKVTATMVRYTRIDTEVKRTHDEQLHDLYIRYGYARKSVLRDRIKRFE